MLTLNKPLAAYFCRFQRKELRWLPQAGICLYLIGLHLLSWRSKEIKDKLSAMQCLRPFEVTTGKEAGTSNETTYPLLFTAGLKSNT